MALTLAGPRLWIMIKEVIYCCYRFLYNRRLGSMLWSAKSHDQNLAITLDSRSQLGAARDLMRGTLRQLNQNRIELFDEAPSRPTTSGRHGHCRRSITRIWENILRQPVDFLISILLSALFVAIFVAEASGNAFSVNILSDRTALASTSRCSVSQYDRYENIKPLQVRAASYSDQCYRKAKGTDGCNFLYSQEVAYSEQANDFCPFKNDYCALHEKPAYTFDTGYVDAKYVGINSPNKLYFRRTAVCAPLTREAMCMSYRSGHDWGKLPDGSNFGMECHNKDDAWAATGVGIQNVHGSGYQSSPFFQLGITIF